MGGGDGRHGTCIKRVAGILPLRSTNKGSFDGFNRPQRRGVAPPSMVSGLMGSLSEVGAEEGDYSEREAVIRNAASNAYGGGADTVSTTYLPVSLA